MSKTKEEMQVEILLNKVLKEERKVSDELYAIKLAQHAIFAVVSFMCIAVVGYLIKSILR